MKNNLEKFEELLLEFYERRETESERSDTNGIQKFNNFFHHLWAKDIFSKELHEKVKKFFDENPKKLHVTIPAYRDCIELDPNVDELYADFFSNPEVYKTFMEGVAEMINSI